MYTRPTLEKIPESLKILSSIVISLCVLMFGELSGASELTNDNIIERMERYYDQSRDLSVAYRLAVFSEGQGDRDRAKKWLSILRENSWKMGVDESLFPGSSEDQEYSALVNALQQGLVDATKSEQSFYWADSELFPESIAFDPDSRTVFAGSLYKKKVVKKSRDPLSGELIESDFIMTGKNGLTLGAVYGIKFDVQNNWLWVLHNSRDQGDLIGALTVVDRAGRVVKQFSVANDGSGRELNDLCLTADRVYVTDSANSEVLSGAKTGTTIDVLSTGVVVRYPNGIACNSTAEDVFLADATGIVRFEGGDTTAANRLEVPTGYSAGGIDGLYLSQNMLIGIQNSLGTPKVMLMKLGDKTDIQAIEFRDAFSPAYRIPTTGVLEKGCLYYIANSSVDLLQDDGQLIPGDTRPLPAKILALNTLADSECAELP